MKRLYLDTNVVLDFLLERVPYSAAATSLLTAAKQGRVTLLASSLTYTIAHYVISKALDKDSATKSLIALHRLIVTVAVDDTIIEQALQTGLPDFEDAVQLFAALAAGADAIVTRDPKGFPTQALAILDPLVALASISI